MTTQCTVYYETDALRHSVECDLINDCIVTTIEFLLDMIKSKCNNPKIKTILFSEVNELPCEVINE